jgi:hypothetical protein
VIHVVGATERLFTRLAAVRGRLADLAGLRWARLGGFDLVVPAAIVLVIWTSLGQLGRSIGGVPFGLLWPVLTAVCVVALRVRPFGRRSGLLGSVLLAGIGVSWVLFDILLWSGTGHLYDLNVYLGSAGRWLDGGLPSMTAPVSSWPSSARNDFFLYPPPLLPFFGLLSRLPEAPVAAGWTLAMVACAYKAYRFLGLSRTVSAVMLAFPPVMIGFESGNIASLTFLLFAAAVRAGGALVVDCLIKVQTGLPALWLIRQRRWRGILAGSAVVGTIVAVTLPMVGLDSWRAWWDGLGYRAASEAAVPSLYGYSYAQMLPGVVFAVVAIALVGLALLPRGRPGLAAMGLASIFASPALWPHGFVFALPAVLMLENGAAVCMLLGAGAFGSNMWLLFYGGWLSVAAARRLPSGLLHPLTGTDGPWPSPLAPVRRRATPDPIVKVGAGSPTD